MENFRQFIERQDETYVIKGSKRKYTSGEFKEWNWVLEGKRVQNCTDHVGLKGYTNDFALKPKSKD